MVDTLMGLLVAFSLLGAGYVVGFTRGEEHAAMLSIKAEWERDARAWEERHERRIRELGVEVDDG